MKSNTALVSFEERKETLIMDQYWTMSCDLTDIKSTIHTCTSCSACFQSREILQSLYDVSPLFSVAFNTLSAKFCVL